MTERRGPGRQASWLIVHAPSAAARRWAVRVEAACTELAIETTTVESSGAATVNLAAFDGLVLVLPEDSDRTTAAALAELVAVLARYRHDRPFDTATLLGGDSKACHSGVVQLVGPRGLINHPKIVQATKKYPVCAEQFTEPGAPPLDLLAPYDGSRRPARGLEPVDAGVPIEDALRYLKGWGLSATEHVSLVLGVLARCRRHYENPRFPALYRPVDGIERNRLDFVLDGIEHHAVVGHKAWTENGARVCRYALKQMQDALDTLARPGGRRRKNLQVELRLLSTTLCVVDQHLAATPSFRWPDP